MCHAELVSASPYNETPKQVRGDRLANKRLLLLANRLTS